MLRGVFAGHVAVGAQVIVVADGTLPTHACYRTLEADVTLDMGMGYTCVRMCMQCVCVSAFICLSVRVCQCCHGYKNDKETMADYAVTSTRYYLQLRV